jgi:3-phenylpropionate/trans-cinnamate dioxygenase ferredoxin reductase subunit
MCTAPRSSIDTQKGEMESKESFVIVGAGLAGAKAAETLRAEGFEGRVVLLGEETRRPYERPPLSKQYLRGEKGFEEAAVHTAEFYEEQEIDLRTSTKVIDLDVTAREVIFSSGERLAYDRLLIATGAAPRQLTITGSQLRGVHYLRTVSDADNIRNAIAHGGRLVIVGAGWTGSDVAASAIELGASVSLVDPAPVPLERVLGREVGEIYRNLHAAHGVDLHLGVNVDALIGSDRVEAVRLNDGSELSAAVVVVGIGVEPRVELATGAGLSVDNGILVDEFLQTSVPDVYAVGDVASVFHRRYGRSFRLEHWSAALNQGPAAARNMLGQQQPYEHTPYFYSDQYDLSMEYRGWAPVLEEIVFRGDVAGRQFLAFWLYQQRVVAVMNANIWEMGDEIEHIVNAGQPIDADELRHGGTDLASLVSPSSGEYRPDN